MWCSSTGFSCLRRAHVFFDWVFFDQTVFFSTRWGESRLLTRPCPPGCLQRHLIFKPAGFLHFRAAADSLLAAGGCAGDRPPRAKSGPGAPDSAHATRSHPLESDEPKRAGRCGKHGRIFRHCSVTAEHPASDPPGWDAAKQCHRRGRHLRVPGNMATPFRRFLPPVMAQPIHGSRLWPRPACRRQGDLSRWCQSRRGWERWGRGGSKGRGAGLRRAAQRSAGSGQRAAPSGQGSAVSFQEFLPGGWRWSRPTDDPRSGPARGGGNARQAEKR